MPVMKAAYIIGHLFILTTLLLHTCSSLSRTSNAYHRILGLLCLRSEFVVIKPDASSTLKCSALCSRDRRCQAFSLADGPCQLFVFDKCSKSVRNCGCSRRGRVFVKQQPGLEAGALCPSGYGDDLCGVKYKLFNDSGSWKQSREKCESESGPVIMADVVDATEMHHIEMLHAKYSFGKSFWLGGFQTEDSAEPLEGWHWIACNLEVARTLWSQSEPSNTGNDENVILRWSANPNLSDGRMEMNEVSAGLCECVFPF